MIVRSEHPRTSAWLAKASLASMASCHAARVDQCACAQFASSVHQCCLLCRLIGGRISLYLLQCRRCAQPASLHSQVCLHLQVRWTLVCKPPTSTLRTLTTRKCRHCQCTTGSPNAHVRFTECLTFVGRWWACCHPRGSRAHWRGALLGDRTLRCSRAWSGCAAGQRMRRRLTRMTTAACWHPHASPCRRGLKDPSQCMQTALLGQRRAGTYTHALTRFVGMAHHDFFVPCSADSYVAEGMCGKGVVLGPAWPSPRQGSCNPYLDAFPSSAREPDAGLI